MTVQLEIVHIQPPHGVISCPALIIVHLCRLAFPVQEKGENLALYGFLLKALWLTCLDTPCQQEEVCCLSQSIPPKSKGGKTFP
jgi:hypothetical protein